MTKSLIAFATFTCLLWSATSFGQTANTLSAQEKAQGWQLLFDGKTVKGWHSAPPPQPAAGRAGREGRAAAPPAQPTPGQVGTPKPCAGAKGDAAVAAPAGSSH